MFTKHVIIAITLCAVATPLTAAEFYVVQDTTTKRCSVVEQRPTAATSVMVGSGNVYTTQSEAENAKKSLDVCNSGTTGAGTTTTTTSTNSDKPGFLSTTEQTAPQRDVGK